MVSDGSWGVPPKTCPASREVRVPLFSAWDDGPLPDWRVAMNVAAKHSGDVPTEYRVAGFGVVKCGPDGYSWSGGVQIPDNRQPPL